MKDAFAPVTLELTIGHKLFSGDPATPLGTIQAKWFYRSGVLTLGKPKLNDSIALLPDGILTQLRPVVRNHVREFLKDTRYSILFNEDTGIETTCKVQ